MAKPVVLPKKPSKLLKLAMQDLEACEVDPHYTIDMSTWFMPNGTCAVCLAGSVMAQRLDGERLYDDLGDFVSPSLGLEPDAFGVNEQRLRALDYFRAGWVDDGLRALGLDYERASVLHAAVGVDRASEWPSYHLNKAAWKHTMATLIGVLEAEGL